MRILIQRVLAADVNIGGTVHASIKQGLLVFLGVAQDDEESDAEWLASKLTQMRIFSDNEGKMNLSVQDVSGEILVISQFTLHADAKKGNRPSFIRAARPEKAIPLYEYFAKCCWAPGILSVKKGVFGADMKVQLINDGPVTIWLDSRNRE